MKKYLMMAAVIIAAVMTSCEKKEAANPLDEFVNMGKYVGMKSADITTDLTNNGWKQMLLKKDFSLSKLTETKLSV